MVPALADQVGKRGVLQHIADLAARFREAGRPVVYCTIAHRADGVGLLPNSKLGAMALKHHRMIAGSADVELPAVIAPQASDLVSSRATGVTAFYGTDLDAMLRLQRVDTVVLAGVSTNIALPGLALEAVNRGYHVVVAEDCTAGSSTQTHEFMIEHLLSMLARVATADQVASHLPAPP
jgi:nicotinamidase-related amidase